MAEIARLAEAEVRDAGGDFRALGADFLLPLPAEQRLRRQLTAAASPDPGPQLLQRAVVEVGQDLWLRLPPDDQERVLRTYHTQLWSFASTIPKVTAAHVVRMFDNGQLRLHAGLSSAAAVVGGGFLIRHEAGNSRANVVVNAITSVRRPSRRRPSRCSTGCAAPHRCAQAASLRSRSGWSPAAISSIAAVSGPDAVQGQQARRAGGDQRDDQLVQAVQLGVQNRARRPSSRSVTRVA